MALGNEVPIVGDKPGDYVFAEWIAGAKSGIDFAIRATHFDSPISVTCIAGHAADTFEDTVRCAAAMAAFGVIEAEGWRPDYVGGQWVLIHPEETEE